MTAQDLKNAIFQLAVQGKLVPQDPNDEPASELLKRIKADKERLIKEGKIKKEKPLPPITEEEMPFELPESWAWVRLGKIGDTNIGLTYKPSDQVEEGGTLVLRSSNIQNGKMNYNDNVYVSCEIPEKARISIGDLLICARNGSRALVGKCAIVDKSGMSFGAFMAKFHSEFNRYIKIFIESPVFRNQLDGVKTETINQITQDILRKQILPLSPLAEQKRIVSKIEELMPLVEEYGKAEERLTALNAEFPDKLRKSILQQAIQGKLTERDPSDEPASELLKRIRAEKERLIKEGKIKKEKPLPPITEEEMPFEIPENWAWVRLGEIINTSSGTNITASEMAKTDSLYPVYGGNGINGYYDKFNVPKDTLVIGRVGYYCGSVHLTKKDAWVTDNALIVRFDNNNILTSFLQLMLTYADLGKKSESTAQPLVTGKIIKPHIIALPPLAEQQRIVDRVNELLAVCEELK